MPSDEEEEEENTIRDVTTVEYDLSESVPSSLSSNHEDDTLDDDILQVLEFDNEDDQDDLMDNIQTPLLSTRSRRLLDSFYTLVESLIDLEIYQQTLDESMDTYTNDLFKRNEHLHVALPSQPLSQEQYEMMEHEKKCHICLDGLHVHDEVGILPCGHIYHHRCLESAVSHQHDRCPLCRRTIPVQDVQTNESGHRVTMDMS